MKTINYFISFILIIITTSCNNSEEFTNNYEKTNEVLQIKKAFESKNFKSIKEAAFYANSLIQDIKPITRAINEDDYLEKLSPNVIKVIERMKNIKPNTDKSPEALRLQLKEVINKSNLSKESQEYLILTNSVDIAIEAIYYAMQIENPQAITRGFWSSAWQVVKCVAGTAGSAGLGAIAGASVGTITLHVVGTVSGTSVGG